MAERLKRITTYIVFLSVLSSFAAAEPAGTGRQKIRQMTTRNGKPFAVAVDIFAQLCRIRYDSDLVKKNMEMLADLGFKRVYFVVCPPGYPSFSSPRLALMPPGNDCRNYALESVTALDSPNLVFCRYAKQLGLEAIAVLKPYEGGGGATVPAGARCFWTPGGRHKCVGGDRINFDTFLASYPEFRVKRRPIPGYEKRVSQPFRKIELTFCLDEIPAANRKSAIPAVEKDYRIVDHPVEFRLWQSKDNGIYTRVKTAYKVRERIEKRVIQSIYGKPLIQTPRRCRIVEITNLKLPAGTDYVAVSMHGDEEHVKRLRTIPSTMFGAFGPDALIPVTTAHFVRQGKSPSQRLLAPDKRLWGLEASPGPYGF